ncbi:MAG: cupin domain-containing protein [Pseudomonadota bacterium]
MFQKKSDTGYLTPVPGIHMKTTVFGDRTLMTEFHLDQGSQLPVHSHPHEQTGYLVSGKMTLAIDGKDHLVEPGDSWVIPGGVLHGATVHENCVAVEVFSPVRKDYLPEEARRQGIRG